MIVLDFLDFWSLEAQNETKKRQKQTHTKMTLLLPLIQRSFFHSTRRIQKPWLVTAYDATDVQALERRLSVREQHLAQAKLGFENGKVLAGGELVVR